MQSTDLEESNVPDTAPIIIDSARVAKLLGNLDAHKASGPEKMPARLLKENAGTMAPILTRIFHSF